MKITFAPRGILQIDEAKIVHRNFAGEASKFNRAGDRNFSVVIEDEETAETLSQEGWNIKIKPPHDEDDVPFMYLPVKVKFNERGPRIYLRTLSGESVKLDEESVSCLDEIDISSVDLDIRPYKWEINGKQGTTAYLQAIYVIQEFDRFAERDE